MSPAAWFIAGFVAGTLFLCAAIMFGMWLDGRLDGVDEDQPASTGP